ncbi:MAG: DUF1844 domain-containing protein [Phycisphaeraceae bacterium]|nr:DUF1844 domain-containing protein [Phycisphaeraceae bacterium]
MAENQPPQIHIDSDWKAQAQAEKQKLAEKAKNAPGAGAAGRAGGSATGPGGVPPANFEMLVSTLATQALLALGAIPDPRSGQRFHSPELARHHIDMLSVIEQKTKGNLSEEEENMLVGTLYELRQRYIQVATASRG